MERAPVVVGTLGTLMVVLQLVWPEAVLHPVETLWKYQPFATVCTHHPVLTPSQAKDPRWDGAMAALDGRPQWGRHAKTLMFCDPPGCNFVRRESYYLAKGEDRVELPGLSCRGRESDPLSCHPEVLEEDRVLRWVGQLRPTRHPPVLELVAACNPGDREPIWVAAP